MVVENGMSQAPWTSYFPEISSLLRNFKQPEKTADGSLQCYAGNPNWLLNKQTLRSEFLGCFSDAMQPVA